MKPLHMLAFLPVAAMLVMGDSCEAPASNAPTAKATEAQRAQLAANSVHFTGNAEIDNIKRRLELTSDPGLLGFIVLLNDAGQPIYYGTVKGKVTSGNKRLTATQQISAHGIGGANGGTAYTVTEAPGDEGTHGSSAPYIFFWTESGRYMQWSGQYLYSDQPIRLKVEPLVMEVSAPAAAAK